MTTLESSTDKPPRCARCGLDVAAWCIRGDDGATYCTSYCAHASGALEPHGEERAELPGVPT